MIHTEKEYQAIVKRVEILLQNSENIENQDAQDYIELNILSDLVADFEETYHPVKKPTLIQTMKLRMYERGLNQKQLSELLGVSTSRISEYLAGKSEPPLKTAREISQKFIKNHQPIFPREGLQRHPFMKCNGIKDIAENPTEAFAEGTP